MNANPRIKEAAVSGLFYPNNSFELHSMFDQWFVNPVDSSAAEEPPRALILPHAGYVYSGKTAAKGYALWKEAADKIKTVVVMGPAHRVGFQGITTVDFDAVETPLGPLQIDTKLRDSLLTEFPQVEISNYAQQQEHSLEVHFPFIKYLFPDVKVLPLLNGSVQPEEVARVLKTLWQQEGVYFVISSDLSHFHFYEEAQRIDRQTAEMVNHGEWLGLNGERACGYKGIQGLLELKNDNPFKIQMLELINSGDTAGDKSRVVGYGAWAINEEKQ
ncbi:MAG: AmmeMemoRadiSam system protein B [Thiomicrorhabdus chilensis]|uniref:AmmeMemoRadiSam system protein B n=1 Tax=Thiomicrorhabdus chilensis TaxID=63656 RepID=UPI00299D148D|nr:AmmeMemoRadiSam system protein B [Thiomicrorhabdus chilensis]MDX1348544.1 AmmeMemoRadiSam system protein B [Thiomicrorhabdus chilensis]